MNRDILQGKWKQLKGQAKRKWGKPTDDDLDRIEGSRDELVGMIQERYGKSRDKAEREVDEWQMRVGPLGFHFGLESKGAATWQGQMQRK
jgi:uncharacterized protein YjbJ (UPF0337 family)